MRQMTGVIEVAIAQLYHAYMCYVWTRSRIIYAVYLAYN